MERHLCAVRERVAMKIKELWVRGSDRLSLCGYIDSFEDNVAFYRQRLELQRFGWQALDSVVKNNVFDMKVIKKIKPWEK